MITLYGSMRSRALRPLWVLHEMGAEFDWIPVIQAYRIADPSAVGAPFNTNAAAFRALNPMGQVPVMTDAALTLSESMAICFHIARSLGGDIAPRDATEDAEALQWAFLGVSAVETPALNISMAYNLGDPTTAKAQAAILEARAALQRPFARIEDHLSSRDWLIGGRFTLADILLVECVRFAIDDAPLFLGYPNLARWMTAARARPAFTALWQARNAEPVTYP